MKRRREERERGKELVGDAFDLSRVGDFSPSKKLITIPLDHSQLDTRYSRRIVTFQGKTERGRENARWMTITKEKIIQMGCERKIK